MTSVATLYGTAHVEDSYLHVHDWDGGELRLPVSEIAFTETRARRGYPYALVVGTRGGEVYEIEGFMGVALRALRSAIEAAYVEVAS